MVNGFKKRLFFLSVCLTMLGAMFANSMQGVLLSDYIAFYGLSAGRQGWMGAFQSAGCIVSCICILIWAKRIRAYRVVIVMIATVALCIFAIGLRLPFWAFLLSYFVLGLGYAGTTNLASTIAASFYEGSTFALGMVQGFIGIGGILAPPILRLLLGAVPWYAVCMLNAGWIGLIWAVYFVAALSTKKAIRLDEATVEPVAPQEIAEFFRSKRNLLLVVSTFGYMAFLNGINTWITRYCDTQLDKAGYGAWVFSVFWIGNTFARLVLSRRESHTVLRVCAGCLLTAVLFAAGLAAHSTVWMFPCMLLCGVLSGASVPQFYHLGYVWNGRKSVMPTSVLTIVMFLSCVLTSPLTAALTKRAMWHGMAAICAYILLAGCALLPLLKTERNT